VPGNAGEWSDIPACDEQFKQDREVCRRVKRDACWASMNERLAWCIKNKGQTGKPALVTR